MPEKAKDSLIDIHPIPGSYLTKPWDTSVGQVVSKADIISHGLRGQSGAYENCLTYGGINRCFDL